MRTHVCMRAHACVCVCVCACACVRACVRACVFSKTPYPAGVKLSVVNILYVNLCV